MSLVHHILHSMYTTRWEALWSLIVFYAGYGFKSWCVNRAIIKAYKEHNKQINSEYELKPTDAQEGF